MTLKCVMQPGDMRAAKGGKRRHDQDYRAPKRFRQGDSRGSRREPRGDMGVSKYADRMGQRDDQYERLRREAMVFTPPAHGDPRTNRHSSRERNDTSRYVDGRHRRDDGDEKKIELAKALQVVQKALDKELQQKQRARGSKDIRVDSREPRYNSRR